MKKFRLVILSMFVSLLFVSFTHAAKRPPNIVLIMADDLGVETLGCYGGTSYKTPHIDALARDGMRFNHAYSMAVCHPTRMCLMTGRYPFRFGSKWGSFPKDEEKHTFAHVLKNAGYATAVAGKWQLTLMKNDLMHPRRLGFDAWALFGWHEGPRYWDPMIYHNGKVMPDTKGKYGPDIYADVLIDFMTRHKDEPFFVYFPMALVHDITDDIGHFVPYGPGKDRYDTYTEMVESMDRIVGRMVQAVDKLGLSDDTLIIFTGDNGTPRSMYSKHRNGKLMREPVSSRMGDRVIPGGKGLLNDRGTHVPLIARWPGKITKGQKVSDLIDFSDFLPTFAELANAKPPVGVDLDGISFAATLLGKGDTSRRWAFAEHQGKYFVRTHRWKLYNDGRLYNVELDAEETSPVDASKLKGADLIDLDALKQALATLKH